MFSEYQVYAAPIYPNPNRPGPELVRPVDLTLFSFTHDDLMGFTDPWERTEPRVIGYDLSTGSDKVVRDVPINPISIPLVRPTAYSLRSGYDIEHDWVLSHPDRDAIIKANTKAHDDSVRLRDLNRSGKKAKRNLSQLIDDSFIEMVRCRGTIGKGDFQRPCLALREYNVQCICCDRYEWDFPRIKESEIIRKFPCKGGCGVFVPITLSYLDNVPCNCPKGHMPYPKQVTRTPRKRHTGSYVPALHEVFNPDLNPFVLEPDWKFNLEPLEKVKPVIGRNEGLVKADIEILDLTPPENALVDDLLLLQGVDSSFVADFVELPCLLGIEDDFVLADYVGLYEDVVKDIAAIELYELSVWLNANYF